jgi:hypothetical protein
VKEYLTAVLVGQIVNSCSSGSDFKHAGKGLYRVGYYNRNSNLIKCNTYCEHVYLVNIRTDYSSEYILLYLLQQLAQLVGYTVAKEYLTAGLL